MLKRFYWALAFTTPLFAGLCNAADDTTVNRMIAAQCAQCHGPNGQAVGDMDGLDDESFKDLMEDLKDMRSEDQPEDIMEHQALGYTLDQLRRIARYYDSIKEQGDDEGNREDEHEH
jgi:sulfide dehydrogenase cytochrome subunit